ncbi:MAG: hypothetical protein LBL55_11085 [Propionibacteriaceae bacterium]|jgi:hypothetical protein|nr:hypothetical protein [Propionibacteriaceae bacterium]
MTTTVLIVNPPNRFDVRLMVDTDAADAAGLRITRIDDDGAEERVPGRRLEPLSGHMLATVTDPACMFGRPTRWRVEVLDQAGGVIDAILTGQYTLSGPGLGWAVVGLDVDPTRTVTVKAMAGTDQQRQWAGDVSVFQPLAGGPPVAISGVKAVSSTVAVQGVDSIRDSAIEAMVRTGAPITVRLDAPWPVQGRLRKAPNRVTRTRSGLFARSRIEWVFDGPDVAPDAREPIPLETWADWVAYAAANSLTEADIAGHIAQSGLTALETIDVPIAQLMGE